MSQIFGIAIVIAGLIGYVLNIIHIVDSNHVTGFVLVRCIGVFIAPLGAILGWF